VTAVALIPAKDRSDTIAATVRAVRAIPGIDRVIVVDDGSVDDTKNSALAAGASVVRLGRNEGKGAALAAGVHAAPDADAYLLVDADLGDSAVGLSALLQSVLEGNADLAIGVLPSPGGRGGFGLVKQLARNGIRRASGFHAIEPLSGQRAVRGPLLRSLVLGERFGVEVGMTIDAARSGARVVELPVEVDHRHTGRRFAGFRHRAFQGRDIVRALWPRLTTARQRMALVVVAGLIAVCAMGLTGSQWPPETTPLASRPRKVVIFGFSHLSFDDLGNRATVPALTRLAERGAVGALSVRTVSGRPSTYEAYASLGAGVRVTSVAQAALAYDADEPLPDTGESGGLAANRISANDSVQSEGVVVLGAGLARRAVADDHLPSEPGALGDAIFHLDGPNGKRLKTAVVGNADQPGSFAKNATPINRPAAVAVMGSDGRVDAGTVSPALLEPESGFGFGVRSNVDKIVSETSAALREASVVVVDPGDMERAANAGALAAPNTAESLRNTALAHTDRVLAAVVSSLPRDALLMVIAPVPPAAQWRVTPLLVAGPGVPHGSAQSPSTKRLGLAAITDLAPTVLSTLGAPRDPGMVGSALRYHEGEVDLGRLKRLDRDTQYRETVYRPATTIFVIFEVLLYLFAMFTLSRRSTPRGSLGVLRFLVLASAAFPLATFALRALPGSMSIGLASLLVLVALCLGIAVLAGRASRHPLAPLGWIMAITSVVILGDVATGSRLHTSSILGYSLQSAGRFYGLPNTTFAVLAACLLLGIAMHVAYAPRRREALVTAAVVAAVVIIGDGAPSVGNDVGGIIALVPLAGLSLWCLSGRKVSWRVVLGLGAVLGAVLAVAAGIDLLRPVESRTHLGRFAADLANGEASLVTTALRKTEANFRILTKSVWTWVIPASAAFMLYLLVWEQRWSNLLPRGSALRIGVVSTVVASVVGFLVNDSGPVVTALFFVLIIPFLTLLVLGERPPPVLLEPAPGSASRA